MCMLTWTTKIIENIWKNLTVIWVSIYWWLMFQYRNEMDIFVITWGDFDWVIRLFNYSSNNIIKHLVCAQLKSVPQNSARQECNTIPFSTGCLGSMTSSVRSPTSPSFPGRDLGSGGFSQEWNCWGACMFVCEGSNHLIMGAGWAVSAAFVCFLVLKWVHQAGS